MQLVELIDGPAAVDLDLPIRIGLVHALAGVCSPALLRPSPLAAIPPSQPLPPARGQAARPPYSCLRMRLLVQSPEEAAAKRPPTGFGRSGDMIFYSLDEEDYKAGVLAPKYRGGNSPAQMIHWMQGHQGRQHMLNNIGAFFLMPQIYLVAGTVSPAILSLSLTNNNSSAPGGSDAMPCTRVPCALRPCRCKSCRLCMLPNANEEMRQQHLEATP